MYSGSKGYFSLETVPARCMNSEPKRGIEMAELSRKVEDGDQASGSASSPTGNNAGNSANLPNIKLFVRVIPASSEKTSLANKNPPRWENTSNAPSRRHTCFSRYVIDKEPRQRRPEKLRWSTEGILDSYGKCFISCYGYVPFWIFAAILCYRFPLHLENQRMSLDSYNDSENPLNLDRDICIDNRNISTADCLLKNEVMINRENLIHYYCKAALALVFRTQFCVGKKLISSQFPVIKGRSFFEDLTGSVDVMNNDDLIFFKTCVLAFKNNPFDDVMVVQNKSRESLVDRYDLVYKNYAQMRKCGYVAPDLSLGTNLRDPKYVVLVLRWSSFFAFLFVSFSNLMWYVILKVFFSSKSRYLLYHTARDRLLASRETEV